MAEIPRAAVIGAGPAGLAAALKLADGGLRVLLLDAEDRLGGSPFEFGCKATDRCANCYACLTLQQIRDVQTHESIEVVTAARVTDLTGPPDGVPTSATGRAAGVIVATGYRPASGNCSTDYGLGAVLALARAGLDASKRIARRSPPRTLAFVQCAGSRTARSGATTAPICCTYALAARAFTIASPRSR